MNSWQIIIAHQLLFQGMFIFKNIYLKIKTGQKIRGHNAEAVISILYFAFFILYALLSSYFDWRWDKVSLLSDGSATTISLMVLALNILLSALALLHLKDSWRVGVVENQKTELITTGIYRQTRNPYFVSYLLMFAAYTILLQNAFLFVLSIAGFMLIHKMIVKEEKYLLSLHGDLYLNYSNKTARYIFF